MHRNEPGDGIEDGGLAAAVGAEQRDDTALGHIKRNVGHADQVAVADFEMLDLQQGRGHGGGAPSNPIRGWAPAGAAPRGPRYAPVPPPLPGPPPRPPRAASAASRY